MHQRLRLTHDGLETMRICVPHTLAAALAREIVQLTLIPCHMFCSEEVLDLFWQWDRTACYLHWRDFVIGVGLCLQADARQAYPPSATLDVRGCCDRGASQADHAPACRGKGALLEGISKKELEPALPNKASHHAAPSHLKQTLKQVQIRSSVLVVLLVPLTSLGRTSY